MTHPGSADALRKRFQEQVVKGKCQLQYVIGIPEIEFLFTEIDRLTVLSADVALSQQGVVERHCSKCGAAFSQHSAYKNHPFAKPAAPQAQVTGDNQFFSLCNHATCVECHKGMARYNIAGTWVHRWNYSAIASHSAGGEQT